MMNDPEKRALALLDFLISTNGLSLRDVDAKCDFARGTTGNLLNRRTRLRFNQIFQILEACNVEPKAFFLGLFPPEPPVRQPGQKSLHQELMDAAERAGYSREERVSPLVPMIPPEISLRPEDLVKMVEERVLKALDQQRELDTKNPKKARRRPAPRGRRKVTAG
ncbi:MAG: hypothetical protein ABJC13_09465 [Acidobacteriota bacterium]